MWEFRSPAGSDAGLKTGAPGVTSNQFQSGAGEPAKVSEIRCREARAVMDCRRRDQDSRRVSAGADPTR